MYTVDAKYVWYDQGTMVVLMYFLNNVPFTFDEVYRLQADDVVSPSDLQCMALADQQPRYSQEDVFRGARYLISEQAHPCFNDIDIQNPEILPDDICGSNRDII